MSSRSKPSDGEGSRAGNRKTAKLSPTRLRIVAGDLGGRYIEYNGDPDTRPMKEKTREAVFSLLGGYIYDTFAIDLFAGTGILGFEAISRGASGAVLLELARPAISMILSNMRALGLNERVDVQNVDSLRWLRHASDRTATFPKCRWIVFCCPPYALWQRQTEGIIQGLKMLYDCLPAESQLICESEESFDITHWLPQWNWDVRTYKPALMAIATK